MKNIPNCPKCNSSYVYADEPNWICPECAHEWNQTEDSSSKAEASDTSIKDAHGQELKEGDNVVVIKDLKIKGSSKSVKVGTKVKNIHLIESTDGHNISCKIDGIGAMNLKSEFVRKA